MPSREESLENWITGETERQSRRERLIPSATDRMRGEHPTRALQAMENVSRFLGLHPEIPMVIGGGMTQKMITLSFEAGVDLPEPFMPLDDGEQNPETWAIPCADTPDLPTGPAYGRQMQALTAFGHLTEGGEVQRMMTNIVGTKILGMAGRAEFKRSLMIGQVMEQATEPWGTDHHIWLVGFGDLANQLIQYLEPFHPAQNFHTVNDLSDIAATELGEDQATIYVMGSGEDTLGKFLAINTGSTGIITDSVVDETSLYICETDDEAAELETGYQGVGVQRFMPNRIEVDDPRFVAMTRSGESQDGEEAHRLDITPEDFITPAGQKSEAQDSSAAPETAPANEDPAFTDDELEEFLRSATTDADRGSVEGATKSPAHPSESEGQEGPGFTPTYELALLGQPSATANGIEVTGQAAEAVAFVQLQGGAATPAEISAALWPGDSVEGNTARTRRSRLVKKINVSNTETITVSDKWTVKKITTDLEEVLSMLADPAISDTALIDVAEHIDNPLDGCQSWAEEQRENMRADLAHALEAVATGDATRSEEAVAAVAAARARLQ